MKRVSLKQIVQRCIKDPKFFRALLRNPQRALVRARMQIPGKDLRKLEKLIAQKGVRKDFEIYIKLVRKYLRLQRIIW